ncbi:hypothetical protein LTR15_010880 [Elasticomyces elasticus]|nr:hypothetical protein LTR15_010880 [Elasticomyces elasticus]
MADTSQGKTLDVVHGILSKLAESHAAIAQSQASLAQSHASLAEGQAAFAHSIDKLVNVQMAALEAQKNTVHGVKEMLDLQKEAKAANTPPPPTMDAGSRLTGVFELLEHILLDDRVAMDILLLAQRVKKTFNATINNSKALQQKLFFISLPVDAVRDEKAPEVNPLFTKHSVLRRLPLYFDHTMERLRYVDSEELGRVRLVARTPHVHAAPFFDRRSGPRASWSFSYNAGRDGFTAADPPPLAAGSWRRMYVSQPAWPVKCIFDVVDREKAIDIAMQIFCRTPHNDASPAHSAGHRLTNVFELLQQILLEMDMKDILLAQRVNTSFASTIANSKPLQQALFFMPLDHLDTAPLLNTLLFEQSTLQRLPLFLNGTDEKRIAGHCEDGGDRLIIKNHESGMFRNPPCEGETWQKYVHLIMDLMSDPRQKPKGDCSILSSGSCEKMYLSQPPCPVICDVFILHEADSNHIGRCYEMEDTVCMQACTVREVLDVLSGQPLEFWFGQEPRERMARTG